MGVASLVLSAADTYLPLSYKARRIVGAVGLAWVMANLVAYGAVLGGGQAENLLLLGGVLFNCILGLLAVWQMPYRKCDNCGHQRR